MDVSQRRGGRLGLIVGLVGFTGVLAAPAVAALPAGLSRTVGIVLLVGGLVAQLPGRRRRPVAWLAAACVAAAIAVLLAPAMAPLAGRPLRTLAVTVLMATWWMSNALPIPATSLVPLVLFPMLGVLPAGDVAANYANNIIFLFLGGFILALGVQRWGLHRRIALHIVIRVGTDPERMVLGFMLATAVLSMWISNTATALMMLPIALAVVASLREIAGRSLGGFGAALLLGVAYSASIGGLATPIGTPPNIAFLQIFGILYPEAPAISFGRWLITFLPLVILFLPIAWLVLTRVAYRLYRGSIGESREMLKRQLSDLGPPNRGERRMLVVFVATALLWVGRGDLALGPVTLPGWAGLIERALGLTDFSAYLHDATVAMTMALLCFLVPGEPDGEGRRRTLMDWETAVTLPWGILLLFGGGFAIAQGFKDSGLSTRLGEAFAAEIQELHPLVMTAAVCLLLTFLTEVTSNTATTQVLLPVLAGTAGAMGVNPLLIMIPATLSASCAFMLPIATPPNAIVFGSGELDMRDMVRAGVILNLIGVALITLVFYFFSGPLLGVELGTVPDWAR